MKQQRQSWLTTGEAAQLCAVTPATVLAWIRKGKLEGARTAGGHYRIKREKLEHLLIEEGIFFESDSHTESHQPTKPLRCWEYLSDGETIRGECGSCVAYRTRTSRCFLIAAQETGTSQIGHACPNSCGECVYYRRVLGLPTRVLVISTDEDLVHRLQSRNCANIALNFAHSAYEASAIAQDFPPAFAVVDGDAFLSEGVGLIEHLSRDLRLPGLKIIAARSGGLNPNPDRHRNGNRAVHVIDRPFGLDQIVAVIESYPVESGSLEEFAELGLNLEGESVMIEQNRGAALETEVNDDGFLKSLASWNRSAAQELAEEHNIGPLTEGHWKVIDFVRDYYSAHGRGPEVVKLHKETGLSTTEICKLFPCGMVKGAYRLAGLPRPPGCG